MEKWPTNTGRVGGRGVEMLEVTEALQTTHNYLGGDIYALIIHLPVFRFHHLKELNNVRMSNHLHDFCLSPHVSSNIFILMCLLLVYDLYGNLR